MKDRGWARVYFIDGKESRSGVKCPVISESRMSEEKRAGGGLSRTHPFVRALGRALEALVSRFQKGSPTVRPRSAAGTRKANPKAIAFGMDSGVAK